MANLEEILQTGGAVILPTETVYGLFAQAMNEEAVEHVYRLKCRPKDKAMNLNVADYETILAFSKNQPTYLKKLYDAFLPGPLTIILQANDRVQLGSILAYQQLVLEFQNTRRLWLLLKRLVLSLDHQLIFLVKKVAKFLRKSRSSLTIQSKGLPMILPSLVLTRQFWICLVNLHVFYVRELLQKKIC